MAYAGSREIEIPDDLAAALHANRAAQAMFDRLTSRNRYALLYRIGTAQRPDTRARRVAQFVEMPSAARHLSQGRKKDSVE